jgi:hypothetical protein
MNYSPKVKRVMEAENIGSEEMEGMIDRSCITSVQGFNRRFCHWLFLVNGTQIVNMQVDRKPLNVGIGAYSHVDDHLDCKGDGCSKCGWSGKVLRWVPVKRPTRHPILNQTRVYTA